jgi:hypothetical protein
MKKVKLPRRLFYQFYISWASLNIKQFEPCDHLPIRSGTIVKVYQINNRRSKDMAFDTFLKIDGIPGESTDDKHKDWMEISLFLLGSFPADIRHGKLIWRCIRRKGEFRRCRHYENA